MIAKAPVTGFCHEWTSLSKGAIKILVGLLVGWLACQLALELVALLAGWLAGVVQYVCL